MTPPSRPRTSYVKSQACLITHYHRDPYDSVMEKPFHYPN